jgi:ABC-type Zn uptake system ZnuABC Zn-binding protein ZnuA
MMIAIGGGMKKMNNLFDRLKPEHKATLEKQADLYPSSIKHIYQELSSSFSFIELKYGSVIALSNFCNLPDYRITNISNLFQES